MVVSQSEVALRPYHVTFMADTKQPVSISLRLDNGDCIRASVGDRDRSARYVSITQRIELGQLSAEEQSKQLDEIAHIYQRLSDCAGAQTIGPSVGRTTATQAQTATKSAGQNATHLPAAARITPPTAPARPKPSASKQISQPVTKTESVQTASHRNAGKRMTAAVKRALKVAVDAVWKADTFGVFKLPVTKRVAPDYYQIVKHPMDLKTVRQNLDKGAYEDEHAFKHDMDLIFYNCELYNGLTSQVGKHGVVVKRAWLKAWEQSGLDRSPKAGAEAPAVPREPKAPKRQLPAPPAQPAPKAARAMPPQPQLAAQMSVQASSGPAAPTRPPLTSAQPPPQPNVWAQHVIQRNMPPTKQGPPQSKGKFPEQRSAELFEWIGESDDKAQDDVLTFLNSVGCNLQAGPDEEVELDPEALSDEVLWQLDEWCQQRSGGKYNPEKVPRLKQPLLSLAPADDEETDED
eukprot:jgi/Ulvmu1/3029/UM015_0069.1